VGAVTKSLIEVTSASRSPRARCDSTSAVAAGLIAGATTSRMKRWRPSASSAALRATSGAVANAM
jgi:hypothetical protein